MLCCRPAPGWAGTWLVWGPDSYPLAAQPGSRLHSGTYLRDHYIWALPAKQTGSHVAEPPRLPIGYVAAAEKA
jgi:hypothetical protein